MPSLLPSFRSSQFVIVILAALVSAPVLAETLGTVVRSQNMPGYPVGQEIASNSEIQTGADQKIAIRTVSGDIVVGAENSTIKMVEPNFFEQLFGKIYYLVTPRSRNKLRVRTSTATLGVRGTAFIVDSAGELEKQDQVSLAEGALEFESNDDEPFALYRKRELTDYEKYKLEMQAEFDAYKNQLKEEFVAFKKSIPLEQGFGLSFDGKRAVQAPLDDDSRAEFEDFEAFLKEHTPE